VSLNKPQNPNTDTTFFARNLEIYFTEKCNKCNAINMWQMRIIWLNNTCKRTHACAQLVREEGGKKGDRMKWRKKITERKKIGERRNR